jgi:glycosyltransferase involved in cell wall biosynthesis
MRVTHVITRLIIGGAQENTIASVLGLKERGIDADLISGPSQGPEGSLEPLVSNQPGVWRRIPELVRPLHPWKDWLAWRKLTGMFRAERPDIVHTHSGKAGILGRLAAHRAGVKTILHTIHGPSFGPFQGAGANALFKRAEQRAGKITTHFVVVADAMRDQYLAAGIGHSDQYTRIFSGFNLEPFLSSRNDLDFRAHWGLGPDDFVVGTIARLVPLKGHEALLRAAPELVRRCPRLKFLWVGDGPLRGRLEETIRGLGLTKKFIFTGLKAPEEVPSFMGIMDAVAHLSMREGLPRALPQALAAGRPVLAYDCDGAREICLENETGFLVAPGDVGRFTEKLLLLAEDAGLRNRLAERGRGWVREEFGVEKMVDRLGCLYEQFVSA